MNTYTYKRISVTDAKQVLTHKSSLLIDIRADEDYNESHDEMSIHLTNNNIASFVADTSKSAPLLIMCYHGNSSQQVAQYLAEQGFSEVYSIDGGYEEWVFKM